MSVRVHPSYPSPSLELSVLYHDLTIVLRDGQCATAVRVVDRVCFVCFIGTDLLSPPFDSQIPVVLPNVFCREQMKFTTPCAGKVEMVAYLDVVFYIEQVSYSSVRSALRGNLSPNADLHPVSS